MQNQDDVKNTKEHILDTCLELIKTEGFDGITVRKIATKAGVNIALINYYFGSKERLLDEAVKLILSGFKDSFRVLGDSALEPRQKLKKFMMGYVGVIHRYHDVIFRVLSRGSVFTNSQSEYVGFLKLLGFDEIKTILRELTGEERVERLFMMMIQIGGAIIGPVLLYPLASSAFKGFPPMDENTIGTYIDSFLDLYLQQFRNQTKED